jgi:hypothetical protein
MAATNLLLNGGVIDEGMMRKPVASVVPALVIPWGNAAMARPPPP